MTSGSQTSPGERALVLTCVLQAALVFLQGVFAGNFLSGVDAAVALHQLGGWTAFAVALVQVGLSVLVSGRTRSAWLVVSSCAVAVAEMLQLGTGYGRFLQVHIPLAILIVGILTWQIVWITTRLKTTATEASR